MISNHTTCQTGGPAVVVSGKSKPAKWTTSGDGRIYFTVTSDGRTLQQWESLFSSHPYHEWARILLRRELSEAPTNGITYQVVVFPVRKVTTSINRTMPIIRQAALAEGLRIPHWEVACLIQEKFTNEEVEKMGLSWIITTYKPIIKAPYFVEMLDQLCDEFGRWFLDYYDGPSGIWKIGAGFAFLAPEPDYQI